MRSSTEDLFIAKVSDVTVNAAGLMSMAKCRDRGLRRAWVQRTTPEPLLGIV